jgi:hypothetical protein
VLQPATPVSTAKRRGDHTITYTGSLCYSLPLDEEGHSFRFSPILVLREGSNERPRVTTILQEKTSQALCVQWRIVYH